MTLRSLAAIKRRSRGSQGFTLVELLIVIFLLVILILVLLLAVLPAFQKSKQTATKEAMTSIGDAIMAVYEEFPLGYYAMTGTNDKLYSSDANAAFGLPNAPNSRSETQLARFLVFITSPTQAAVNAAAISDSGGEAEIKNRLSVEASKTYRLSTHPWATETYPVYVDGWGNAIIYQADNQHVTQGGAPAVRLISAGPDGDFATEDDNYYWDSAIRKVWDNLGHRPE